MIQKVRLLDPAKLVGRPVYKDGMFTHLKGIGWVVDDYHCARISLNLTHYATAQCIGSRPRIGGETRLCLPLPAGAMQYAA